MLLSRNWLREFVDIPDSLDPRQLAERITIKIAEVEHIEQVHGVPAGLRLPPGAGPLRFAPGASLDASELEDWIIEIDNKSITHRPDLWGHYGMAREIAAMLDRPLRPYLVTPAERLGDPAAAEIPIVIDDPRRCARYTALRLTGLRPVPSPPILQVRLARCGLRPIDLLVDLTNYVMLELGQPMHAFDGAKVSRIEVAEAAAGERFRTLDGVDRVLPAGTLMIQSGRRSIAIAGVMGGADSEVSTNTSEVLLESANFDAATVRRAAAGLSMRTEASARFEKSLDPGHTVLGIGRFVHLAREHLPGVGFGSRLSDSFPRPLKVQPIEVDLAYMSRFVGQEVPAERVRRILGALEFKVEERNNRLVATPPSFRATKDVTIEADVIEEIARSIGYDQIQPSLPRVTTRYLGLSDDLRLERETLRCLCSAGEFVEVYGYIWYDDDWLGTLGFAPGECITLRNPAAAGSSRLRRSLLPGLIRAAERNRHHQAQFHLAEIGSVFNPGVAEVEPAQERRLALAIGVGRSGDVAWEKLKQSLEGWARQVLSASLRYDEAAPNAPWEDPVRTCTVHIDGLTIGRLTLLSLACRQRIDERLRGWSIAFAEISLTALAARLGRHDKLPPIPAHPPVRLDFSLLVDARRRYAQVADDLRAFEHPLLRRIHYVGSFEGKPLPEGRRSLTLRVEIGRSDRTLTETDLQEFRQAWVGFVERLGLELRA